MKTPPSRVAVALRQRAEASLRKRRKARKSSLDTLRDLHELQVHQIELELQNEELVALRSQLETLLQKYTDLYDFAPVGYFSVDESGIIREANLTGASLLGVERSRLIQRPLSLFTTAPSRSIFLTFLTNAFRTPGTHTCEVLLKKEDGETFLAGFRATPADAPEGIRQWCRIAFSDITAGRRAAEAQSRVKSLIATNEKLNREMARRQKVEHALKTSEQHQSRLLEQSRRMQARLRRLSHQILHAQEEERKRISRELHDEIAQTLVGINIRLAALSREALDNPRGLQRKIARTQRMVEKSVETVHRFARELRPAMLDDLGLIPALHAAMRDFTKSTGVRARLTAFAALEKLSIATRIVLYRVAHEALHNVARHAQATSVDVVIEKRPEGICMTIQDDGKSFDVIRAPRARGNSRLGLLGMRERLEMVGGSFSVDSVRGQGTTIKATLPASPAAVRKRKTRTQSPRDR